MSLIRQSGLFNEHWYLSQYPDVREAGNDPLQQYLTKGGFEGRNPGPDFDSEYYLRQNKVVEQEGINPLVHFLRNGQFEGRIPKA